MRRGLLLAVVIGTLSALLPDFLPGEAHSAYWWQHFPAFDLVYGLLGCVALVLVSKALGSAWLQRSEDYYRDEP